MKNIHPAVSALLLGALLMTAGCKTAYYGAMETVGIHKRDILVDRIDDVRKAQHAAKDQFKSALDVFMDVVDVKATDLQKAYDKLDREYEKSEKRATDLQTRVAKVESVSKALFKEWKAELKQYQDPALRRSSEQQLKQTETQYRGLMATMKSSAASMDPVLGHFRDQVLFLKHNLNSQAIAGLKDEAVRIESSVTRLIQDMEASIAEADAFIREMGA